MDINDGRNGLGARTAQLEDLQFWEKAKESLTVPTKYSYKNSKTHNDRGYGFRLQ
jgi:hypothetical protein